MSTAGPARLKVVLGTNVYFSAFTHRLGRPSRIWQKAISGRYTLLVSPVVMRELARVLLRDRAGWQDREVLAGLKLLARVAQIVEPAVTIQAVPDDETDNRILECALAGNADLIVSGDHHLKGLKTFQGIAIIRPVDFSRTLEEWLSDRHVTPHLGADAEYRKLASGGPLRSDAKRLSVSEHRGAIESLAINHFFGYCER